MFFPFKFFVGLRCWIAALLPRLWRRLLPLIDDVPVFDDAPDAVADQEPVNARTRAHDATPHDDDEFMALTDDEIVRAGDVFVESLLSSQIEALASRHNSGRSCRVVGRDRGSYNACFFVKFDSEEEWVVRIPIEPAVHRPWEALLSEVATIK